MENSPFVFVIVIVSVNLGLSSGFSRKTRLRTKHIIEILKLWGKLSLTWYVLGLVSDANSEGFSGIHHHMHDVLLRRGSGASSSCTLVMRAVAPRMRSVGGIAVRRVTSVVTHRSVKTGSTPDTRRRYPVIHRSTTGTPRHGRGRTVRHSNAAVSVVMLDALRHKGCASQSSCVHDNSIRDTVPVHGQMSVLSSDLVTITEL